jgi:hypothetical protein
MPSQGKAPCEIHMENFVLKISLLAIVRTNALARNKRGSTDGTGGLPTVSEMCDVGIIKD